MLYKCYRLLGSFILSYFWLLNCLSQIIVQDSLVCYKGRSKQTIGIIIINICVCAKRYNAQDIRAYLEGDRVGQIQKIEKGLEKGV